MHHNSCPTCNGLGLDGIHEHGVGCPGCGGTTHQAKKPNPQLTHNPEACISALKRVKPRSKQDAEAIIIAIACMNHMQNVIQRQRK